ncbi:armadillo-type protein [Cladochytrium replicatum]|nr:armadillo-type protein [Cladochytrium replicatum]
MIAETLPPSVFRLPPAGQMASAPSSPSVRHNISESLRSRRSLPAESGDELKHLQRKLSHVTIGSKSRANCSDEEDDSLANLLPSQDRPLKIALYSGIDEYHINAMVRLRRFLCLESVVDNTQLVLEMGVLDRFLTFLNPSIPTTLLYESCWVLTNIAAGLPSHTRALVDAGFVPPLVNLLRHSEGIVRTQAAWALGNIAGDSHVFRDLILANGALGPLMDLWNGYFEDEQKRRSGMHVAIWAFANLCRWRKPDWQKLIPAFPVLQQIIQFSDHDILSECCWALSRLFHSRHKVIDRLLNEQLCLRLVELLTLDDPIITNPILRTMTNIASGDDEHTQMLIDAGALPHLVRLLNSPMYPIRLETLMTISNIAAGTHAQVQALIDLNIIATVLRMLNAEEDGRLKKESVWVLCNAASSRDLVQTRYLVHIGLLESIMNYLMSCDDHTGQWKASECLYHILLAGDRALGINTSTPKHTKAAPPKASPNGSYCSDLSDSEESDLANPPSNDNPYVRHMLRNQMLERLWEVGHRITSTPCSCGLEGCRCVKVTLHKIMERWFRRKLDEIIMIDRLMKGMCNVSL